MIATKGPIRPKWAQKAWRVAGRDQAWRSVRSMPSCAGAPPAPGAGAPAGRSRMPRRQTIASAPVSSPLPTKVAVQPIPSSESPSGTVVPIWPIAPARPVSEASRA